MKRNLFAITFVVLFCTYAQAQLYMIDKISLPATGEEFGLYAEIYAKEALNVYYDLQTSSPNQQARAKLSSLDIEPFISSLTKAKKTFEKWTNIAKQTGTPLFSKRIPTTFSDQYILFTNDNKWFSERGVDMWALFLVNEHDSCHFILQSDYMTSEEKVAESSSWGLSLASSLLRKGLTGIASSFSSTSVTVGHYCPGASLTFNSSSEIDEFIKKLQAVRDWKQNNINEGKLFN